MIGKSGKPWPIHGICIPFFSLFQFLSSLLHSNFDVTIDVNATDSRGVDHGQDVDRYSFTYSVIVQAVADTPTLTLDFDQSVDVEEGSDFKEYPIIVSQNDNDGSEADMSVVISYSTPGGGNDPHLNFNTTGITIVNGTGNITLTGSASDIKDALESLEIKPGENNGEDINVTVTATAFESNPTETGVNEVAVPTASTTDSFVIIVNPVIQEDPVVTVQNAVVQGTEDIRTDLGQISVSGVTDSDGSEVATLEVDVSTFPLGSVFFVGGVEVPSNNTNAGWLALEGPNDSDVSVLTPGNYSGTFTIMVRGTVVDQTTSGQAVATSTSIPIEVIIDPVADGIVKPKRSTGHEDSADGKIPLGVDINKLSLVDDGSGSGNNDETETISQIEVKVPDDDPDMTYILSGGTDVGTATVAFNSTSRTYTISSTLLPSDPTALAAVSSTDRKNAEADIRYVSKCCAFLWHELYALTLQSTM